MFDVVLLDTAPLLTTNDATEVLSVADQVVIVSKAGKTHKEAADRAAELLERRHGPVVGVVLVGATDIPTSRYYYYGDVRHEPEPGRDEHTPLDELASTPASSPLADPPSMVGPLADTAAFEHPLPDTATDATIPPAATDTTEAPEATGSSGASGSSGTAGAAAVDTAPADLVTDGAADAGPVASTDHGPTNGTPHGPTNGKRNGNGRGQRRPTDAPGTDPAAGSLRGR